MASQLQQLSWTGNRFRRRNKHRPMAEINVTPFVDVMLVLLIVFMATAPLLTSGVSVDLPKSEAGVINDKDDKPLELSVKINGEIYIGETLVSKEKLIPLLNAMTDNNSERRIYIRGDQGLSYGKIMDIIGSINKAGFKKVALLSEPE